MSAAVPLRNVVGVSEHLFLKAVVPLHGHLDAYAVLTIGLEENHVVKRRLVGVQVGDEGLEPAIVKEMLGFARALIH